MKEPIIKYLNRSATAEDLEELNNSLSDKESLKEFVAQKNNHVLVNMLSGGGESDRVLWEKIKSNIEKSEKEKTKTDENRKIPIRIFRFTASAAAVLLLLTNVLNWLQPKQTLLEVPQGQNAIVYLPDGTKVTLSSDSRLSYPGRFSFFSRKVELTGEAFFEVTRKSFSPFIVSAGEMDVKVLGTKFNVSAYPTDTLITVYLQEGSVCCYGRDSEKDPVILEPHQQIAFGKRSGTFRMPETEDDDPMWTRGVYQLKDKTLGDAIGVFERIYGVKFYVYDTKIRNIRINGSFSRDDSLDDILSAINSDKKLKITRKNQQITITLK